MRFFACFKAFPKSILGKETERLRSWNMAKKLWKTCQKCGCDKIEDTEKLCESCKAKRKEYWTDLKKIGGVAAAAFLTVIVGRRFKK